MYLPVSDLTTEEVTRELEYASGLRARPISLPLKVIAVAGIAIWWVMRKKQ